MKSADSARMLANLQNSIVSFRAFPRFPYAANFGNLIKATGALIDQK